MSFWCQGTSWLVLSPCFSVRCSVVTNHDYFKVLIGLIKHSMIISTFLKQIVICNDFVAASSENLLRSNMNMKCSINMKCINIIPILFSLGFEIALYYYQLAFSPSPKSIQQSWYCAKSLRSNFPSLFLSMRSNMLCKSCFVISIPWSLRIPRSVSCVIVPSESLGNKSQLSFISEYKCSLEGRC